MAIENINVGALPNDSSGDAVRVAFGKVNNNFTEVDGTLQYIIPGTGAPEGVVTAPVGTLYLRTDGGTGTTLYVKELGVGNTGWVAK